MSYIVEADPTCDILSFDPDRDMAALAGGIAGKEAHQQNPDISSFVSRGGSSCCGTASTIPRYAGDGDANAATSFQCTAP